MGGGKRIEREEGERMIEIGYKELSGSRLGWI